MKGFIQKCRLDGKESAYNAGDLGLIPGSGRFPWRREWYPTPVFVPGEFYGQKSLVGYSLRGHEELNTTEQLTLSLFIQKYCKNDNSDD